MQLGTVGIRRKVPNLIECAVMALVHVSLFLLSNIWFNLGKVPIELNIWGEGEIFHCSEENLFISVQKAFFFSEQLPNSTIYFYATCIIMVNLDSQIHLTL